MTRKPGPYRILTNLPSLPHERIGELVVIPAGRGFLGRLFTGFRLAISAGTVDAALLNCAAGDTIAMCLALRLMPWIRTPVLVSDAVMNPPVGQMGPLIAGIKRWALRRVDRFLVHQRDLAAYDRWYGIGPDRSVYVPFKVNLLEKVQELPVSDGGYLFSCGVTNRDWPTLGAATKGLPIRVVVSEPDEVTLANMGAIAIRPRRDDFGTNAEMVTNGTDPDEWLRLAAGATAVVLPVTPDAMNPSGVSTYLTLMALGKCIVISDGPATREILDGEAIVVPPGDPAALRAGIERVLGDAALRAATAERGRAYALSLGEDLRLTTDLALHVVEAIERRA